MYIVTAAAGGERAGCLVGFACQCSIEPPRFMAWISVRNRTHGVARAAEIMVVHVVPEDALSLAELFGGHTGDAEDKFARCAWRPGPGGAPVLDDCPRWFAGRVLERVGGGDHEGFMLEPVAGAAGGGRGPLTFQRARSIDPGHDA